MTSPTYDPVSTAQIANLLAWARSLSEAGPTADPDQRAAYQAAKTALLARLAHQHPDTSRPSTKDVQ
jgi:hypothetical protein